MSNIESKKLIDHLTNKWVDNKCPLCATNRWNISDKIYELREYNEGTLVLGGTIVPLIPVTCQNCGNTVFINSIVIGITKLEKGNKDGK